MNKRDLQRIAVIAIGSFGATLAIIGPAKLNAVGPDDPQAAYTAPARPLANGVEFTLRMPNQQSTGPAGRVEPASHIAFELVARNTLDKPVDIPTKVTLAATEPVAAVSRLMPSYSDRWQSEGTLSLKPNETRIIPLTADFELKPRANVAIRVTSPTKDDPQKEIALTKSGPSRINGMPEIGLANLRIAVNGPPVRLAPGQGRPVAPSTQPIEVITMVLPTH